MRNSSDQDGEAAFTKSKKHHLLQFILINLKKYSLGKVLSLQPFFITYPTEKEISLCLCKMCLNAKLLFEQIKAQAKKNGDACPDSITEYFMSSCGCPKSQNGYYQWKRVTAKYKECKGHQPVSLKCQYNSSLTKVSQFELVTREYIKKKSEKTERVEHQLLYTAILKKLNESKWAYVLHKYQIYNDKLHWPIIPQTVATHDKIYHMDFSKNLTQLFKYKPQSSHFNKSQYSLYCETHR